MDGKRKLATTTALCAALAIDAGDDGAPEWINLLPEGPEIRTVDGRGPYSVGDLTELMEASLAGGKLVLDVNHATDHKAPKGDEAPARGWIVELQAREGKVWGKVEWTPAGRQMVADGEYRGISPALEVTKTGKKVLRILRASLVNQPNLEGLVALHQENEEMALKEQLITALNLAEDADDDAIVAAVKKAVGATETAAQSALAPIRAKLKLADDGDIEAAIVALQSADAGDAEATIAALQAELAEIGGKVVELQNAGTRGAAEAFVDRAIELGRVGVKPMRDRYIAMHQADPAGTEELINAKPALGGNLMETRKELNAVGEIDDVDLSVIALMGVDPDKFKATRAAEAALEEVR